MSSASVRVQGEPVGTIGPGLLVLVAVAPDDDQAAADWMAGKLAPLRIFADAEGRMNRSVLDVGGHVLLVSQFTLYGDVSRGRRPSFVGAARPEHAIPLLGRLVDKLEEHGVAVQTGAFGEHMEVELVNDGPVTIILDSPANASGAG